MDIKKVNNEEASQIIKSREPIGLFYTIESYRDIKFYIGIDNSTKNAWTEEFKNLSSCKRWLLGNYKR